MTEMNKDVETEYNSLEQYKLATFVQAYLQNVCKVGYGKVALDKVQYMMMKLFCLFSLYKQNL